MIDTLSAVLVYVENNAGMAFDHWSAAWTFDLDAWGRCGQGPDESAALADLREQVGGDVELTVAERSTAVRTGDELAFARDRQPCRSLERAATLDILTGARRQTIALVESCPPEVLDWADPERVLPSYASWRTIRQLAWHIVNTESRYYLPCTGLGNREPAAELLAELEDSAAHVRSVVEQLPADLVRTGDEGCWTSVKLLRRLAWHERGELVVMRRILERARAQL